MSPVKYELGLYIPDDGILHSHRRENLKSYIVFFYSLANVERGSMMQINTQGIVLAKIRIGEYPKGKSRPYNYGLVDGQVCW
jgi:hypothetical protein